MTSKKVFSLFLVFLAINIASANSYADNSSDTPKKEIAEKEKGTKTALIKLIKKEPLTEQDEKFLEALRNYSLGTLSGLTCFYLIPPVGFGVLSAIIVKGLFAVAGGYGLVELFKAFTLDEIKEKFHELFNKKEEPEKIESN